MFRHIYIKWCILCYSFDTVLVVVPFECYYIVCAKLKNNRISTVGNLSMFEEKLLYWQDSMSTILIFCNRKDPLFFYSWKILGIKIE